jgi:hypothetical protein
VHAVKLVKNKIDTLKKKYNDIVAYNKVSGHDRNEEADEEWFANMDEALGNKPISQPESLLDTAEAPAGKESDSDSEAAARANGPAGEEDEDPDLVGGKVGPYCLY